MLTSHTIPLLLAVVCVTPPLPAQETAGAVPDAGPESEKGVEAAAVRLSEELVVTARRKEESIQTVPMAVTLLTGRELEEAASSDLADIQSDVPNLSVYAGRNQSTTLTAFLRGVGQADPLWGVDPGVGLYLDDVYIARPQGALLDVFDVQRIEVLRGPQGTLYGKNTIGGAIKYVSREVEDRLRGGLSYTGGSHANHEVRGSIGGGLVQGKLRGRAAAAWLQHRGYGTNLLTGQDVSNKKSLALRLGLDWLPSDGVEVKLSYDHTRDDAAPKGLTRLQANPFCPLLSGGPCPPEAEIFDTRSGLEPLNGTDSEGYALDIRWSVSPAWRLRSITAYRQSDTENNIDFDTSPGRIADVIGTLYDEQTSQELQLQYAGRGRLGGIVGFYYFGGEAGGLVKNIFLDRQFVTTDGSMRTESFAAFADFGLRLGDRLTLSGGLRFTSETKTAHAYNAAYTDDSFGTVALVTAAFDKDKTFASVAPRVSLDYRLSADVMAYLSGSRGFKSGGFNIRANTTTAPGSDQPFEDEALDVVEVGLKSLLLERRVTLAAAAFYGDYTDVQVSTFTTAGGQFFGQFLNAGDATLRGVELELDAQSLAFGWLGLAGQLSYLDADVAPLDNNHDGFVDTQVITNAPRFTATLRASARFSLRRGAFAAGVRCAYRDDSTLTNEGGQYPGRPGTPLLPITQPAYSLWDASLSWLAPGGHWRLAVNARNLSGAEYLTSGFNVPSLGILQGSYGAPRTVLATIAYRF
ncbi:MAG TPA: TonB-dependent receptor [Vicinamibacteria bacterium]|nr:TonB-dependent receptor [Vicinamibacteria bacterium]